MHIVDSQVHIWGANTPERPWPPTPTKPHRAIPVSSEDLLREMNGAGVERVVIVPPTWDGARNDLALEAARLHPHRFAVMGRMNPEAPDAADLIPAWRRQPGMLGVRFHFGRPEFVAPLADGRLDKLWSAAEKAGVPLMLNVLPESLHLVDRIAQRHPGLKMAIDHLAITFGKKDAAAFAHFDKLLPLAQRPNIAVKASAMPGYSSGAYPYRSVHPYLRQVYDAFGPRRMFWGTDFSKLTCSYRQTVTMFTEELPWLTAEDKEWIMGRGVCEWLGWPLD